MKHSILFAAVALAFSTGAIAQNDAAKPVAPAAKSTAAKLSDVELDQVTAGVSSGVMIGNPGKPQPWRFVGTDRAICINCDAWVQGQVVNLGAGGLILRDNVTTSVGNWR